MLERLDISITTEDILKLSAEENLIFDEDLRTPILQSMNSIDVQACPGSGKTTLIAAKLILLAKKWSTSDRGICVLSHTNVAKDEIIERLKKSKTLEAQRLLSYPHFIGTIQEFVGKYVGLPKVRSSDIKINTIDTDSCIEHIYKNLSKNTKAYIDKKSTYGNPLYDFDLEHVNGKMSVQVPTFKKESESLSYRDLLNTRIDALKKGYLFYKDVYAFGSHTLWTYPSIIPWLQKRFPFVLLDEMQDTQKFQDELLTTIFPLDSPNVTVQRFGDPDQAIFNGINGEESNSSFNGKTREQMSYVINKSHRFSNGLAEKIAKLSFNQLELETELEDVQIEERKKFYSGSSTSTPKIIFYDKGLEGEVIKTFSNIVSTSFTDEIKKSNNFTVKALGAVGNDINDQEKDLKIGHYLETFEKGKSKKSFKEKTLIGAFYYCRRNKTGNWHTNYKIIIDCFLKILQAADIKNSNGAYLSQSNLKSHLEENASWDETRKAIYRLLDKEFELNKANWEKIKKAISKCLKIPSFPNTLDDYLSFHEEAPISESCTTSSPKELSETGENAIIHPDGFTIEFSTIHGVKGESHDATLIVETKNYSHDINSMLPYLTGELPSTEMPNENLRENPSTAKFKPNQKFMRQLYVGMSRPKHLLCLALNSSEVTEDKIEALTNNGWEIRTLSNN